MESFLNLTISKTEATQKLKELLNSRERVKTSVAILLIKDGADPNIQDDNGNTLLHHLVQSFDGDCSFIDALLNTNNADINIRNNNGKTAFECLSDSNFCGKFVRKGETQLIVIAAKHQVKIGNVYYKKKNYPDAILAYQYAMNLNYEDEYLYYNLGCSYLHNNNIEDNHNNFENAISAFKNAIRIKSDYANAYHFLATAYLRQNKFDLAIESSCKSIKYNYPHLDLAHSLIANAYYKKREYQSCIDACDLAIKINSKKARSYHLRGKAYIYLNQPDLAIKDFIQALTHDNKTDINPALQQLIKTTDLFLIEKKDWLDLFKLLPEEARKTFKQDCRNRNTTLGERLHYPEGLFARGLRLIGKNPDDHQITKCSPDKGKLGEILELFKEDGELNFEIEEYTPFDFENNEIELKTFTK